MAKDEGDSIKCNKPIRVAQVVGEMANGGVEGIIMDYYRHIDHEKVQFDFIVLEGSPAIPRDEIERLGGRVFLVPRYKKLPAYLATCERIFRETKPDIVHANVNTLSVFPLLAAKRVGVKVRIAHSHSTANPQEHIRTAIKTCLRPFAKVYPTHLAACSEYSGRWLFGNKAADEGRIHIIRNAIDLKRFAFGQQTRDAKRAELGLRPDQLVIGQVGRMCPQKNQLFTLDVFQAVLKQRPDAVLLFVGVGKQLEEVKAKAAMLGLSKSVRFLGVRHDTAELYQAFDVLAFPSTYEGLGMVAVEAQATGLPVVASNYVPPEADILQSRIKHIGLGKDVSRWSRCLLKLASDCIGGRNNEALRGMVAERGYDIDQSANQLESWYELLMGEAMKL